MTPPEEEIDLQTILPWLYSSTPANPCTHILPNRATLCVQTLICDAMAESAQKSDKKKKRGAETLFLEGSPIHAMTAFFIALPTEQEIEDSEIEVYNPYAPTIIQQAGIKRKDGKIVYKGFPQGMAARRILLYIFARAFANESTVGLPLLAGSRNQTLRQWGYSFGRSPTGHHPAFEALERLYGCEYEFTKKFRNSEAGFNQGQFKRNRLLLKADELPLSRALRAKIASETVYRDPENYYVNPFFGFTLQLPVYMKHVINLRKKSSFWNVYMFLIDVLPNIPKGKSRKIPWEWVHDIFQRRYNTTANFKLNFIKHYDEVCDVYKPARGKVKTDNSEYLILKHALPPIARVKK